MTVMPEMHGKGVPFSRFSGHYSYGKFLHTGGVTGSIPVAPTTVSSDFAPVKKAPTGSNELEELYRMPLEPETIGTIYFVAYTFGPRGKMWVKIGFTTDFRMRLANLQTALIEDLTVVATFRGTRSDEATLHERLASCRKKREWFRFNDAVDDLIYDLKDATILLRAEHGPDYDPTVSECLALEGARAIIDSMFAEPENIARVHAIARLEPPGVPLP